MTAPLLDVQIEELRLERIRIAALVRTLGERELDGRLLRLTIETELRDRGTVKTEAEKLAKTDKRYLAHEEESLKITYDRMVAEARAEAARFNIQLQLAALGRFETV